MNIRKNILNILTRILQGRPIITKAEVATYAPNQLLEKRCAIITGGTSGIGYAIAEAFLKAGATVIITGRGQSKISNALQELNKYGTAYGYVLNNQNVNKFDSALDEMLKLLPDASRQIDILVNNAGIGVGYSYPNTTEEDYDTILGTNLKGAYFLSQTFGKYLVRNNIKGNILNIESSSSLRYGNTPYVLSKWGLRSLTLGLAKTLAPFGITVNAIAPGPTATPMLNVNATENITHEKSPLGRYILPEEVANGAVFLVSDMGRAILGDTIYMTGGAGLLTQDDVPYNFNIIK